MPQPRSADRANAREDARAAALAEEFGAQLGRLKGAGPKIKQFLSMVQLDRPSDGERSLAAFGALPDGARTIPFGRVRRVIEQDLDARIGRLFDDIDEEPYAVASLGQVHKARTSEGDVMRAVADGDAHRVHEGLAHLGYLPHPRSVDPDRLLEHLAAGGEWMLARGIRRIDAGYVSDILQLAYPPRSPHFPSMRRMTIPP